MGVLRSGWGARPGSACHHGPLFPECHASVLVHAWPSPSRWWTSGRYDSDIAALPGCLPCVDGPRSPPSLGRDRLPQHRRMSGRMEDGSLTSARVVDTLIDRIGTIDDPTGEIGLRAMAALADDARSVAAERDAERSRGDIRGPLHGLPVVVKDNIEVPACPARPGPRRWSVARPPTHRWSPGCATPVPSCSGAPTSPNGPTSAPNDRPADGRPPAVWSGTPGRSTAAPGVRRPGRVRPSPPGCPHWPSAPRRTAPSCARPRSAGWWG